MRLVEVTERSEEPRRPQAALGSYRASLPGCSELAAKAAHEHDDGHELRGEDAEQ